MKKTLLLTTLFLFSISFLLAQKKDNKKPPIGLGIKGGLNFANITNASEINSSSQTGFLFGAFFAPPSKKIISSRTEVLFSRQGYNYNTNTNTGSVNLDYIVIPQLMGINITKFVQLQVGLQMAFLINAKADSSKPASGSNPYGPMMDYYNKFDYGAAFGAEIYPLKNLIIGARYNISFGDLYKDMSTEPPGTVPPFIPPANVKNNVLQLYAGLRF
jgi:hypothetical protein